MRVPRQSRAALRAHREALRGRQHKSPPVATHKGNELVGARSAHGARRIVAGGEQRRVTRPELEQRPRHGELDSAVVPMPQPVRECTNPILLDAPLDGFEQLGTMREIHAPPVVGIDEAKVPQLRSLIEVRHTWRR